MPLKTVVFTAVKVLLQRLSLFLEVTCNLKQKLEQSTNFLNLARLPVYCCLGSCSRQQGVQCMWASGTHHLSQIPENLGVDPWVHLR